MDQVIAASLSGKTHVFRRNFEQQRWDSVSRQSKTARVRLLVRSGVYFLKVTPDDGVTEEFERELSGVSPVHTSGQGFIQVPLPGRQELFGIRFKDPHEGELFYAKIEAQMKQHNVSLPTPADLPSSPPSLPPGDTHLPDPVMSRAGAMTMVNPPSNFPAPQLYEQPLRVHTVDLTPPPSSRQPPLPMTKARPSALPGPQPSPLPPPPSYPNPAPPNPQAYHPPNPQPSRLNPPPPHTQPSPPPHPQATHVDRRASTPPPPPQPSRPPNTTPTTPGAYQEELRPPQQVPRPPQQPPRQVPRPQNPSSIADMTSFLTSALNMGNQESAAAVVKILTDLPVDKRKFTVSYDSSLPMFEEKSFSLEVTLEFQASSRKTLTIFLSEVNETSTIQELQQMVELQCNIPRAAQNWIIGSKLIKSSDLGKPLESYDITGATGKASSAVKVFIYVMNASKVKVADNTCRLRHLQHLQKQDLPPPQPQTQPARTLAQAPPPQAPPPQAMPYQPQQQPIPRAAWEDFSPRQQLQPAADENPYDVLSSRGYQPRQQQLQQTGPSTSAEENTYEVLQTRGYQPQQQLHPRGFPLVQQGGVALHDYQQPIRPDVHRGGPANQAFPVATTPTHLDDPNDLPQPIPFLVDSASPGGNRQLHPREGVASVTGPAHNSTVPGLSPVLQDYAPYGLPAPPLAPPPKPKGWVCPVCTFENLPRRPGCEACTEPRPLDYIIPMDCPLNPNEVKIAEEAVKNDQLFYEMQQLEKDQQVRQREENFLAMIRADDEALITNDEQFDCAICFTAVEPREGVRLRNCLHQFCKECLHGQIMESFDAEVKCPECNAVIDEREIKGVVSAEEIEQVHLRALRQAENAAGDSFHCRNPDCKGFCFYEDEVNEFDCPICHSLNCLLCNAIHRPEMDCKEYQDDLKRRAENDLAAKATHDMLQELLNSGDAMNCPSCKIVVQKKGGCDWMMCSMCKTEICWATKGPRWGAKGRGDNTGGCGCRMNGKKCHPQCRNCH